jgi:hypothetical protein
LPHGLFIGYIIEVFFIDVGAGVGYYLPQFGFALDVLIDLAIVPMIFSCAGGFIQKYFLYIEVFIVEVNISFDFFFQKVN